MQTSTNTVTFIQRCKTWYSIDRSPKGDKVKVCCILIDGHDGNCFSLGAFGFTPMGFFIIAGGRHWVSIDKWPKDLINLPWSVYEDYGRNISSGVAMR